MQTRTRVGWSAGLLCLLSVEFMARTAEPGGSTTWNKHNSLQNQATLEADWAPQGKDGYRIEAAGLHLLGDTGIKSRFLLADKGQCTFVFTARNRNLSVDICGETIEVMAVPGALKYVLEVKRQGRKVEYALSVETLETVGKGKQKVQVLQVKPVAANAVQIKEKAAEEPSPVRFSSHRVRGPRNENSFQDVVLQAIVVNGPVRLPETKATGGDAEGKQKKDSSSERDRNKRP